MSHCSFHNIKTSICRLACTVAYTFMSLSCCGLLSVFLFCMQQMGFYVDFIELQQL